ncbi:DPAGT1 like N-acetylglucosamine-phosphate transferase [Cryptosporidium bovis]|uniref:DPAGT1 like N-acetylglucosamine-phosphate transferase n=1 Tax=Cryptosporidium bovis TaxID=310047 RepID=UPI00351A9DF3|nr:DPAGT1 like N-acetylglucosamine-phosphate transferase [Cryptosporidium bovis]
MRRFYRSGEYLFATVLVVLLIIVNISLYKTSYFYHTFICSLTSIFTYIACMKLIPTFGTKLLENNLYGIDLNKGNDKVRIPESLGIVPASIFMITAICSQLLFSNNPYKLLEYNSGLFSIFMMAFLGFVDDVLCLKWRYKMILPVFAALPTLVSYSGGTQVVIPLFKEGITIGGTSNTGKILFDLGYFYYLYMLSLMIFCTNSINIYSGVNGLEVGQSVIISISIIIYNIIEILTLIPNWQYNFKSNHHFFSILLLLPFTASSLSLFHFNRYPSLVFVGDTYTYFAGACFAILFGIYHCPRHRIPRFDKKTGKLESSKNFTLLNLVLEITGPLSENRLVSYLLILQVLSCFFGFLIRYSSSFKIIFE